jgi:hypothetical protein
MPDVIVGQKIASFTAFLEKKQESKEAISGALAWAIAMLSGC